MNVAINIQCNCDKYVRRLVVTISEGEQFIVKISCAP
jgi:hypothetical protein